MEFSNETILKGLGSRICALYEQSGRPVPLLEYYSFEAKWCVVYAGGSYKGRAFNFTADHAVYGPVDPTPLVAYKKYIGRPLPLFIQALEEKDDLLHRSLLMAALNAFSAPLYEKERLEPLGIHMYGPDHLDFIHPEDKVTIVGAGAYMREIAAICGHVDVIDMRPESALYTLHVGKEVSWEPKGVTFHGPEDTARLFAASDVVILTGSTMVNGTLVPLLKQARNCRVRAVFGPSSQVIPEYLKELGIDWIFTILTPADDPQTIRYTLHCESKES